MVTLDNVYAQAQELADGDFPTSVKFTLWCGALSVQQTVSKNCAQAELLRPYIDRPLPDRETLWRLLRKANGVLYGQHVNALYHIEYLERSGQLQGLEHIGDCYLDQCDWRERVYKLVHGHGLAWKCVSLAALILDPLHCELVPVDRHVLARLGYGHGKSCTNYKRYLAIEAQVQDEQWEAKQEVVPTGLWHWYKWEEYRQNNLHSKSDTCETHGGFNPRRRVSS